MTQWLSILLLLIPLTFAQSAKGQEEGEPAEPTAPEPAQSLERSTERGPVKARVILEPDEPVIGDPLTLTLEVTAEQGVELIMPEFGQSLDRFAIRDFVPRETLDDTGRTLATQRYRLSVPMSGPQFIPPIAIEFVDRREGSRPAPDGEDAYEILTERLDFEVQSVLPQAGAHDLEPPLGELAPIAPTLSEHSSTWLLVPVVLIAIAGVLGIRIWLSRRSRARRASAYEVASNRLTALTTRPRPEGPEAMDAFFVELTDLVRHYLEDRFGLHAPELTTEEFLEVAAGSPDLNDAHKGFLKDFLRRADQVKFAHHMPEPDYIEDVLDAAGRFLAQTRGEVDRSPAPGASAEAAHV